MIFIFHSTVVNCSTLADPDNGQVNQTTGTTFGQTATYSCDAGYNLEGDTTRMCQATGMWSRSEPTCTRMFWHLVLKNNSLFYYAKNFISSL